MLGRFGFTASRTQIAAYLFGVALFSISFLVFLNSAISFVITQRIGQSHNVGDAVGTLGFADELVALVACPAWGMLSDRVGVRVVAVSGYAIVGFSLWVFVQAKNVYPQLLLARLLFSVGGAATATMVTAILPSMTHVQHDPRSPRRANGSSHTMAQSISSELTITPTRYQSQSPGQSPDHKKAASASHLAGMVGMFTGCGALVALLVFLPLPTQFQKVGRSPATAVADAFYVVGAIALLVALGVFFGLRSLPGEQGKGLRRLWQKSTPKDDETNTPGRPVVSLPRQFWASIKLGFKSRNISLGYLGGFVARASSVAISLYIPLFTNTYFLRTGLCAVDPDDPTDIKHACPRAYKLAAALTGVSQLVALLCAPLFGFLSARYPRFNIPLLTAALAGVTGYIAFGTLSSPDPGSKDGTPAVFFIVMLLGISQIGAIVCSLGLLARGIHNEEDHAVDVGGVADANANANASPHLAPENADVTATVVTGAVVPSPLYTGANAGTHDHLVNHTVHPCLGDDCDICRDVEAGGTHDPAQESSPLLGRPNQERQNAERPNLSRRASAAPVKSGDLNHLKGSIAGTYSLFGAAGILLLTKAGGVLFDKEGPGAPFLMMAGFNAILFVVGVGSAVGELVKGWKKEETLGREE